MTRARSSLAVASMLTLAPAVAAGPTESSWVTVGGDFSDPANWDGPVPDDSVTAVFDLVLPAGPYVEFGNGGAA